MTSRFDRTASAYAAHAAAKSWDDLVAWCLPRADDRALDVGAGPGALAAALARHVAEVVALDPSEALLAHAPPPVRTVSGRAERLPFPDASFTLVVSVNALHHIPGVARALDEMARVLAPGGRLVIEDYLADDDVRRARRWDEIERARDRDHCRLVAPGEVRTRLLPGLRLDAEETWLRPLAVGPWLELAGCEGEHAARIRAMVGADEADVRVWRGRFSRPA